jgi:branched-chain amino acid aminotransferase
MGGRIVAWDEARIHVSSEALIRGISVFEGIKGYWSHDGRQFSLLALREHFDRLNRSASLQQLPFSASFDDFKESCTSLVRKLITKERDLWLRPTVLPIEGHWGADTVTDLVVTCYQQEKKKPDSIRVGISTWQRPLDNALPARIKCAANYQAGRLARMEGRRHGFDDMILLNQWGRVAEATGSCVILARDGHLVSPPPHEGCLESITVNIVESLCRQLSIPFERRPVDRSELLIADEIALAGTLMELGVVRQLDGRAMPPGTPLLTAVGNLFWACARGESTHPSIRLTPIAFAPGMAQELDRVSP